MDESSWEMPRQKLSKEHSSGISSMESSPCEEPSTGVLESISGLLRDFRLRGQASQPPNPTKLVKTSIAETMKAVGKAFRPDTGGLTHEPRTIY
jgi:hypothetical protein